MITYGPEVPLGLCPVCGEAFLSFVIRDEPVILPEHGRHLGWWRTIKTFIHPEGHQHRVSIGCVWESPQESPR